MSHFVDQVTQPASATRPAEENDSTSRTLLGGLVGPTWIWLVLFMLLPLLLMFLMTFRTDAFNWSSWEFTLENYRRFIETPSYHRLLLRSVWLAFVVAALSIIMAYPVAYFVAFHAGRWRNLLITLLIIPAMSSFLLRVLAWRIILGSSGFLSTFLLSMGLIDERAPILLYTPTAVIITLVYVWLPYAALPIAVALNQIEPNLLEAASDLGAKPITTFLRVTLPLSLPGVLAAFLFVFIPTLGEYVTPALVGGPEGIMIGNIIWDQFSRALNWPMGAVLSLSILLVILIPAGLVSLFSKVSNQRMASRYE
ncbi:MAG: ABC transporter permease [Chloroflexota bacterium]